MCPCNKDYFFQTRVSIIKHLVNFHCHCVDKNHETFVDFCRSHTFGSTILNIVDSDGEVETNVFVREKARMNYVKYV